MSDPGKPDPPAPETVITPEAELAFQHYRVEFIRKLYARAEARAKLRGKKPNIILDRDVHEAFEKFTCNIA
jgi:hypothetical protein